MGYYFGPKQDHMLYAADFVAYLLKIQDEAKPSVFKQRLIDNSPDIAELIGRNEIVDRSSKG